mgnify:CR=1 FL=1
MSNRTVTTNMLEPGTTFMVRGKLTFSRLTRFLEGQALLEDINRRTARGWQPVSNTPYLTATVCEAQVLYDNPNAATDANVKQLAEKYAEEGMYLSKTGAGYSFTTKRTAPTVPGDPTHVDYSRNIRMPWLGQRNPDNSVSQIKQEGELDNGLLVTLVMRVFKSKGAGRNNGVSLDGIILEEPVRYYRGASQQSLQQHGIVFKEDASIDMTAHAPAGNANPATAQGQTPFPQPATPVSAPQMGNEFNNTPVQQPPQQAPAQAMPQTGTPDMASAMNPPQTNNQSAFTQPTPQTANPAQAQPQQAAQPVNPNPTGFQGSESQGIHYNPGDMGRNY